MGVRGIVFQLLCVSQSSDSGRPAARGVPVRAPFGSLPKPFVLLSVPSAEKRSTATFERVPRGAQCGDETRGMEFSEFAATTPDGFPYLLLRDHNRHLPRAPEEVER
jgi:hypothetical protein